MNSALLSKIQHNPKEAKEEIINEDTMKGQEDMLDAERLHQRILEMKQKLAELLNKEGKRKYLSFTPQNSPMEEATTIPKLFRQQELPSPS
ncbi:hypothetical protein O181_017024 [Austropuccinia psidii MF-1]|uniref:Uncharacterized protein n=1 Tax=Austropuccinia psidii MF-1 TaxID=1389203 RepID=A0A9Q3GSD4_9BASI|nr:hypothetical protein [Austropuccinia psidii MF-1]